MIQLVRCAGVMTPLFALRQPNDNGIGDLGALKRLIDWCYDVGLKFILLLPVNACGRDYSPYNAISSVALEPLFLDLNDEELFDSLGLKLPPREFKPSSTDSDFVCYEKVSIEKHTFLYECLKSFEGSELFTRYLERNKSWLEAYALFCALIERFQSSDFLSWPGPYQRYSRSMKIDDPKILERSQYHKFCQWLCDASWKKIKKYATKKKVMLLGDLPFSISRQSADVWQHPERFSIKWNAGAPPEPSFQDDEFVRKWGQNWGLPLYDWEGQKKLGHPWWKKRLEILARYFHGYRLDHALGYFRVYAFPWNPSQNSDFVGKTPEEVSAECGELPRFFPCPDDNEQNKLINLENGRRFFTLIKELQPKMLVVAEDLGLVPDYVRPFLEEIAVPGMKIPHFERLQPDLRYQPVDEYPACSLATWATHDHPPLAALWRNWQQKRHHSGADEWEVRCFLNFIGHREDSFEQSMPEEIHLSALHKISSSRSSLLCLQFTDWFKLEIRYNLPGLQSYSNWSARLPFTVDALFTDKILKEKTQKIKSILLETDRIQLPKKMSKSSLQN